MKALRLRSIGIALGTAIAASTLALVATGEGPTAAPARPAGGFATTPNPATPSSMSDMQRAINGAGDVLRSASARQRTGGGNFPPHAAVGNLIDTISLSAAQPVVAGRARLSAFTWVLGEKLTLWHSMSWDTERNMIFIKTGATNGQTEVAINVMRELNRVYMISCAITAPIAECSVLATTDGWSKVYPIRHNLPDMVYWIIPAKKEGSAGWTKAALTPSTDGSWAISQCDISTYQAP